MNIAHQTVPWYQLYRCPVPVPVPIPASCGKIAEMTIWTSRISTPKDQILKYIIWLARKTVIFDSWHDRFEYYFTGMLEFDLAGTILGSTSFPQSKTPQLKNPQSKKNWGVLPES